MQDKTNILTSTKKAFLQNRSLFSSNIHKFFLMTTIKYIILLFIINIQMYMCDSYNLFSHFKLTKTSQKIDGASVQSLIVSDYNGIRTQFDGSADCFDIFW
jgi:hypothetical protein